MRDCPVIGRRARSPNRHLYPPRSASPASALPPISRHPYPRGFAAGVLSPHHPARADIDDDGGGGTGRSGTTFTVPWDLRRHGAGPSAAGRTSALAIGRTERGEPTGWPIARPESLPSARLPARQAGRPPGYQAPSNGNLRWFMRPHIQMKSRGRIPRRLRPQTLRGSRDQTGPAGAFARP